MLKDDVGLVDIGFRIFCSIISIVVLVYVCSSDIWYVVPLCNVQYGVHDKAVSVNSSGIVSRRVEC